MLLTVQFSLAKEKCKNFTRIIQNTMGQAEIGIWEQSPFTWPHLWQQSEAAGESAEEFTLF